MKIVVHSFDKDKKKLEVILTIGKENKEYTYIFNDIDYVNFKEIREHIRQDFIKKNIIQESFSEIKDKSKIVKWKEKMEG